MATLNGATMKLSRFRSSKAHIVDLGNPMMDPWDRYTWMCQEVRINGW